MQKADGLGSLEKELSVGLRIDFTFCVSNIYSELSDP